MHNALRLAVLIALISASPAFAISGSGYCRGEFPEGPWLDRQEVYGKLKDIGFDVRYVRLTHGCFKVRAYDMNGVLTEFYVNPATAELMAVP